MVSEGGVSDVSDESTLPPVSCPLSPVPCRLPPTPCWRRVPQLNCNSANQPRPTGVEGIDVLVEDARVIHPTHYVVFWALESTAKHLSRESAGGMGVRQERLAIAAEAAWTRCEPLLLLFLLFVCVC